MKYGDLVEFHPIDTVIQLKDADNHGMAETLVKSYVISDAMADKLAHVVVPNLRVPQRAESGLMVIGNYGTGKSHLMSLISAVAEDAEMLRFIQRADVATALEPIAGKMKVVRTEIGAVDTPLRDIIVMKLEEGLRSMGVQFTFPPVDKIANNKDALESMMAAFEAVYPDSGLLLVLDELLDYLRSRTEQALILDLGFLRELGETVENTRFRFMSGLQESLFDSGRFQHVAASLRRVQQRFALVPIDRTDVTYVVEERLLKKTPEQKALVREHLEKFSKSYSEMADRMDEYVRMYPIHPRYIDTFQRVTFAEKREALKTLSRTVDGLLKSDVPADQPGIASYDSYWAVLEADPSNRSVSEIREVMEASDVIAAAVQHGGLPAYQVPIAERIVNAISVHRLTTGDVRAPIGLTPAALRDDLAISIPNAPEHDPEFLETSIDAVLQRVSNAVSGKFLSVNPENGQYYIDLDKDIDYDKNVEEKAEGLDESTLDRYYFETLTVVLEQQSIPQKRTGFRIWEYDDVEWAAKKVTRPGYLFLGSPAERSNTQPPRDYYLYFTGPYAGAKFKDELKADEVFFKLKTADEAAFRGPLALYAAARELVSISSGEAKRLYAERADKHFREMSQWLKQNARDVFDVVYRGQSAALGAVLGPKAVGDSVRDLVNMAAAMKLAPHFEAEYPEYPQFESLITPTNRAGAVSDALKWIASVAGPGIKPLLGAQVLRALSLIDDSDRLAPEESKYAKQVLDLLGRKGEGQVMNRSELVETENDAERWIGFKLETDYLAVVLAALVATGRVVVALPQGQLDSSAADALGKVPVADIAAFRHIKKPSGVPVTELCALFELLGLSTGVVRDLNKHDEAAMLLQSKLETVVADLVRLQSQLQSGLTFWGAPLYADEEAGRLQKEVTEYKDFLESLRPFNSGVKLRNFRHSESDVKAQSLRSAEVGKVRAAMQAVEELAPLADYLSTAMGVMPDDDEWMAAARHTKGEISGKLAADPAALQGPSRSAFRSAMADLKSQYISRYVQLHDAARLDASGDARKKKLLHGHTIVDLRNLARIDVLPRQELSDLENQQLIPLTPCPQGTAPKELDASATCRYCGYRPVAEGVGGATASARLESAEAKSDALLVDWAARLKENLSDPTVAGQLGLLEASKKGVVESFMGSGELPNPVSDEFIDAMREVLGGLDRVAVDPGAMTEALKRGGMPVKAAELRERFNGWLDEITRGKDPSKVRIVIERDQTEDIGPV